MLVNELLMSEFNLLVKDVILESFWWDLYGVDLVVMFVNFVIFLLGYFFFGCSRIFMFFLGYFFFSWVFFIFIVKLVYVFFYNFLVGLTYFINRFFLIFFIEIWGGFIEVGVYEIYIKMYYFYINIIGLGDLSFWRVFFLGRIIYFFIVFLFM